ncbi:pericentrin isoform X2 [Myripristis murdjan]|uniref:pericentrin isoform X2 n=1 Tax=Myripristis murdjan TaxID=586833 RepID=UPI001175DD35|nr:A-kinase anchor protein 9-like isoform X2 [Myripristis murdjan]
MDEDERQRKLEAGRAKKSSNMPRSQSLASFRQKRAKSDSAGAAKKTQKRKGQNVSQNDRSTQDRHLEPALPSASDAEKNSKTNHEELQKPRKSEVQQDRGQKDQSPTQDQNPSPVVGLGQEDVAAFTGKDQLEQLQQAVEKRNEIIARLSSNLQEALASRDQVQLEAQSLAGQIQALQKQLQQTSVDFLRFKSQSGPEVFHAQQQQQRQPGPGSKDADLNHREAPSGAAGSAGPGSRASSLEGSSNDSDTETDGLLHQLKTELDLERENFQRICAELAEEKENHQHVVSLLEEERKCREEERKEKETLFQDLQNQLSQAQTQCLEIQQYKEEKEKLNREVQELRRKLHEEQEAERRLSEEVASTAMHLQSLEEERERQEEELSRLKEEHRQEVERVRQLLEERGNGLEFRMEEDMELKASKNKQNLAKVNFSCDQRAGIEEADLEDRPGQDCLIVSVPEDSDILMERYLSSAHPSHSHSSLANENQEQWNLQDSSANCSFELNSEVFGDQADLSASHSLHEESDDLRNVSIPQCSAGSPDIPVDYNSIPQSPSQCLNNSATGELETSEISEQPYEDSDLGKELLNQQCVELQEELAIRERELNVLKEEVARTADELEEARSRWAQVTDELREALWDLEEEKEKRRTCDKELEDERERRKRAEEEINLKAHEQDNLKNKLSALLEERDKLKEGMMGKGKVRASLLLPSASPSVESEKLEGELKDEGNETEHLSFLNPKQLLVSSLQEVKQAGDSAKQSVDLSNEKQLQALQAHSDQVMSELEETRVKHKTTAALLDQRTVELDAALKELSDTRAQIETIQKEMETLGKELEKNQINLDRTERERSELESQLLCLKQNLTNLEEAQAQGVQEKQEHGRKVEELDGLIKKMEQVLEEELEQFENLLKAKDDELAEEREKWEDERQEKDKALLDVRHLLEEQRREQEEEVKALVERQLSAVEEATERLRKSHQEEVKDLMEKHQQQVSELNICLETELLSQKATIEEEHMKQMSLIKQVNERDHQRTVAELCTKHKEELSQLRIELSAELRESMEAAHQVELQQAQTQHSLELEAMHLSLTNLHSSQLELSQANLHQEQEATLSKVQDSLKEKWTQEVTVLQAQHQSELDRIRNQNQEQQDSLREQHRQDMDELRQQWETRVSQERASMEEKQFREIQALRSQWEKEAEDSQLDLQASLSETQMSLTNTQTELADTQASLTQTQTLLDQTQAALTEAQEALSQTQSDLRESQVRSEEENQRLQKELSQARADRHSAARAIEELVSSHKAVLLEKEQHAHHLEEKEQQLQQEVLQLQEEQASLKKSSEQEAAQLWSQIESMRTSRQELGELKEQLLARSSHVDDIERLKAEFNEQRQEIKEQNEAELDSLRRYFEQRLQAAEENYREEIALLQLRLVEGALEETVLKTGDTSSVCEDHIEEDKNDVPTDAMFKLEQQKDELDTLRLLLEEKHKMELANLRSSMTHSYKEELRQVRSDLTDRYYEDLQELKSRHAMDLEQLRARLSDSHLRELTRVRLEAAREVEVEVEQRMWCFTEEQHTRMTIIQTLENRLSALSEQHKVELRQSQQQLKQEFAEELEEAQKKERESTQEELTLRSQEELQRLREELQENHEAQLSALRGDLESRMEEERRSLEKELQEEREKLKSLQASLDNDQSPQVLLVRQRLSAQFDSELQRAKSIMAAEVKELTALLQQQSEERLHQTQERFQEEKAVLEQRLTQKNEISLGELRDKHQAELEHQKAALLNKHSQEMDTLNAKHKAQLDSLNASHRDLLAAMALELDCKHKAELVALEAAFDSKRKAELDSLKALFQETSQAQLEALEAELARKHQEEKDELERRMLGNMDTLEATYLKEVQTLRDEMVQLEEKHCQEVNRQKAEHRQMMERQHAQQLSIGEELRKELAQVHMEKFSAMAAELSNVHQTELSAQKEALDAEHCKALENLKKQVLELEQQHSDAFQKLSHTYTTEKEQLTEQHQLQLQELRSVSARELEACRRELEEESSRQRLHFLEEVELLKVQSEERLQDRISQLKVEFEEQKEVELEEQRRSFTSEHEEKERSYMDKMSQLTAQLQQLDAVVAQLRAEVGCLQGELEGKRSEMETLDTLLQRRERESQEGGNLLKMLTEDLQTAKEERRELHQANDKLRKVLIEMVRSTVTTEELIGQRINVKGRKSEQLGNQKTSAGSKDARESGISAVDLSLEDQELTQFLCESLLVSDTQIHPGGEEAALSACSRLRHMVDTLLELLNQANTQLEQTHDVHLSLEERFSQGREDSAQLLKQHKLLLEQLDQEAELKSQLQLELHKAEGLLEGYVTEKAALEESLQQKEVQEERLVEELEDLKVKLHQMQGLTVELDSLRVQHQELSEEHTVLLRQREHLTAGLGDREKALVAEAERLSQERLDLQRQAEKDRSSLSLRLRTLETELEEQESKGLETEVHYKAQTEDLNQRIQALEKQLKHSRQFIDEQAVEREHERDEFQQEIRSLEAQLKQTARGQSSGDNKGQRVESLQTLIKDKTEDHASLLAANQQAQRDVAERNEEIDKLAGRIRELEQALLSSAESNRSVSQLEQELHRMKLREQELTQDKQALEQQQLSNRLQISALQSKLDETRHFYHNNTQDPTQQLRDALDTAQHSLQSKEREVEVLVGQLEQVQRDLNIKEVELKHLTLQLELLTNQNAAHVTQLQEEIVTLKENVSRLTILEEEREGSKVVDDTEESLPSALLQEKNQEIDHLNQEIQRLEQEIENTRNNTALEAELEELRSQVEHLHSDITRLRQDKQEEEERLHEVISTLQAELATLGPTLHEVSDSQDGDSINPSPAPSPEPHHYPVREPEKKGGPDSLKQELRLTHSASSRSLRSRLEALQSQLETAVAEKAALERLLLTQEEEYRGHGEELGKRLREEREKAEELQSLLVLKEAELEEAKRHAVQLDEEREKKKLFEVERDRLQAEVLEMSAVCEEKAQLSSLVLELRKKEGERVREMETLKTKEEEMKREIEDLREGSLTLERQVQEARAQVLAVEGLVAEGKVEVDTLETVKGELSAEREALRRREGKLQEEIDRLRQEVTSQRACIEELNLQLKEKSAHQEEAQKEVLTNAEVTLAKADAALRQREAEIARLGAEHQALRAELTAVKEGLSTSTERADKLQEEGQTKDRALAELEASNQRLKVELRGLQEDLAVQEEELAYQQRELQHLRQRCHKQDTLPHNQGYSQKDISQRVFEDAVCVSRDEASLSSPEVLRRLECSEDRIPEGFHTSVLGSRLSEFSNLNSTGLDLPHAKTSPRVHMEPPHSRTITPDPATQSTHSPGSVSVSDNLSMLDSLDADKVHGSETLDLSAPPSPLGSTSSLSAPEWASDGYGSNVSSELGVRLRVELEQTERLDAQFVEYLRCRGMNPTVNTDSAAGSMSYSDDLLSPELQELLKKVYQESCRILTLSQRRATSSSQPHVSDAKTLSLDQTRCQSHENATSLDRPDKWSSAPPLGWQQEKRALQETVIALRELLCRMAQRDTQPVCRGDSDWQGEPLQTARQDETQLRMELQESQKKLSTAYSTQQEQKNTIQSLRVAVEEGEEVLRREQTRVQQLQRQLEQERAVTLRKEREEEERREAVRVSFEQQGSEIVALKGQVEQERVACSNLRRELQIEQSRSVMLEKRLEDTHKDLEDERQRSARQQDLSLQEKSRLEHLLAEAESHLADTHSQLADAQRKMEEERDHFSKQLNELSRRQETDTARDKKVISDLCTQLEQERKQGEELASSTNRLRAELLQSRRRDEKEDRRRREELQKEQEAAIHHRVAMETLREQKQEASHALEVERERNRRQGVELKELKERLQLMKDKEREREEQWERERRKERQEQMERERRQERTNNKLCELELLRQQDQQRMQELQHTLAELEREEKEMAAQRLSGQTTAQLHPARSSPHLHNNMQTDSTLQNQQSLSSPSASSSLMDRLLRENSELTERVTTLSQDRVTLKHTVTCLERQLRRSENELAKVTTEIENRPLTDAASHGKVQRLYERYLRAESFRKSLVYQKRYLLLLLGGFQECEQATLCLIAQMGARPSPPITSQSRPITRFRAAVRAVIAISRMRFLTRKWQRAIRKLSVSGTVNGHASGSKAEFLRQQKIRSISDSSPPKRDSSAIHRDTVSTLVPPIKSPFRLHNRSYSSSTVASGHSGGTSQDPERSLTEYIHHLEKVQQRLVGTRQVSKTHLALPPKEEMRRQGQTACSPDMIGYRQRWLQENRTWLYLSCLSPLYLYGPGSSVLPSHLQKPDH